MNRPSIDPMTVAVTATGVLLAAAMFVLAGAFAGVSAAVGALIAVGNWFLYRIIVERAVRGQLRRQVALIMVLVAKMGILMALLYFLIARHWVDPVGFLVGVSALVGGLLVGSVLYVRGNQPTEGGR